MRFIVSDTCRAEYLAWGPKGHIVSKKRGEETLGKYSNLFSSIAAVTAPFESIDCVHVQSIRLNVS